MLQVQVVRRTLLAMCLLLGSAGSYATDGIDAQSPDPVTAIWHLQQIEFEYRSTNIYYSCDGLRNKIASIMKAVGARDSVKVELRCRAGGLTNNAATLITVATPVEATLESVTAATTFSPETQLAARLNKVQLPTPTDLHRFNAEWRTVELNRNRRINLEAGDCDLLQGLIKHVFPRMSVRVTKQRMSCSQSSGRLRPTVHVAALMPTPVEPMAYAPVTQ